MNVMHNDFILVKSKKNRRRKQSNIINNPLIKSHGEPIDEIKLNRRLDEIIKSLETEEFSSALLKDINNILTKLSKTQIDSILCYGIGKFSDNLTSQHQLAILLLLKKTFNSVVHIFDPVFDEFDINFLRTLQFEVIEENEEGKRVIEEDKLTLVFLPHCPKQLVNNFLWANWNANLRNCIIVSNSFSKILENNTKRTIAESANYIEKSFVFCDEIIVRETNEFSNVLNDTSIHYFEKLDSGCTVFDHPAEEPKYLEDTEFVTKRIQELRLVK